MSADDAYARRVEAALLARFRGTEAHVAATQYRGAWRAYAWVVGEDWRVRIDATTPCQRKREAVRGVAVIAGVADALTEEAL